MSRLTIRFIGVIDLLLCKFYLQCTGCAKYIFFQQIFETRLQFWITGGNVAISKPRPMNQWHQDNASRICRVLHTVGECGLPATTKIN